MERNLRTYLEKNPEAKHREEVEAVSYEAGLPGAALVVLAFSYQDDAAVG